MEEPIRSPAEKLLARSPVFGALDAQARGALARAGRDATVAAGSELFCAGDPCEHVLVLLSGRVRLWRITADGHRLVLHLCEPGEILGQMSALDGAPHSVGAAADEDCRLLAIPAAAFRELLERRPVLAVRLAAALAARVRDLSDELEAMKFASIGERVLRWLQRQGAARRDLRVTHQQLADQVGGTRENVSRVLGLLQDRGILRLGRGRIEILDHARLEAGR